MTAKVEEITRQLEYYLSDENLKKDVFFHDKITSGTEGYVDLSLFLKCNKVKNAGWSLEELKKAASQSATLELDTSRSKIRRKGNAPLPELSLLNKKRKKDKKGEGKEEEKEEEKASNDPIILSILCDRETDVNWKEIINKFKELNPNLKVTYGRFNKNEGNLSVLKPPKAELNFTDSYEIGEDTFNIKKTEGDELINFWKLHGSHYEMCVKKKEKRERGKKNKAKNVSPTALAQPVKLGQNEYSDSNLIRTRARKILTETPDGTKIKGEDHEFLYDLLKYHKNFEAKSKNFDHFTTGKPEKFNNSRCFLCVDKEGKSNDFSVQKCVDSLLEKEREK